MCLQAVSYTDKRPRRGGMRDKMYIFSTFGRVLELSSLKLKRSLVRITQ